MEILTQHATKIEPNSSFSFVVSDDYKEGIRIDKYIAYQFPLYSRNFFQQLIDDGLVEYNGQIVSKQSLMVKSSDAVTVTFPPERKFDEVVIATAITEKQLDIEILAKHEHFLIVYKPANLLVHRPSARSNAVTLVDWLLLYYKELVAVGHSDRPAIIHRLDKDTSGLLVIPRTPYAHAVFGQMFRNRTVSKTYQAIVHGNPPASGSINLAIGRDPNNKKKMAAFLMPSSDRSILASSTNQVYAHEMANNCLARGKKIRTALTHYRVLEYFENHALLEVKLITGRMHQLRVHFSAIGHAIVGDPIYGIKSKLIRRQALHAGSISFTLDGKEYAFSKAAPEDFKCLVNFLKTS